MVPDLHWGNILGALIYSTIGLVIFAAGFIVVDKLTPYHLWNEIIEHQNTALAIIVGAVAVGIAIIVAAAIH